MIALKPSIVYTPELGIQAMENIEKHLFVLKSGKKQMQVGDLIRYTHTSDPKKNDTGVIFSMSADDEILIFWSKTGPTDALVKSLLCHPDRFEMIRAS
jgi:hypothetical protein